MRDWKWDEEEEVVVDVADGLNDFVIDLNTLLIPVVGW